jgi:hypothetical protein
VRFRASATGVNQDVCRRLPGKRRQAITNRLRPRGRGTCDNADRLVRRHQGVGFIDQSRRSDNDDLRKFIAPQHDLDAPQEHRLAGENLKLLRNLPPEARARTGGNDDSSGLSGRNRLFIVHS